MTTLREAAAAALEALTVYDGTNGESKRKRVLATLRAALAEPQEPVAWRTFDGEGEQVASAAVRDVLAERRRQVEVEGWTPEHDDEHSSGDLMQAAICYAMGATFISGASFDLWPWDRAWWKPKDRRSNLVRATALLIAEIERLDRAASNQASTTKGNP